MDARHITFDKDVVYDFTGCRSNYAPQSVATISILDATTRRDARHRDAPKISRGVERTSRSGRDRAYRADDAAISRACSACFARLHSMRRCRAIHTAASIMLISASRHSITPSGSQARHYAIDAPPITGFRQRPPLCRRRFWPILSHARERRHDEAYSIFFDDYGKLGHATLIFADGAERLPHSRHTPT